MGLTDKTMSLIPVDSEVLSTAPALPLRAHKSARSLRSCSVGIDLVTKNEAFANLTLVVARTELLTVVRFPSIPLLFARRVFFFSPFVAVYHFMDEHSVEYVAYTCVFIHSQMQMPRLAIPRCTDMELLLGRSAVILAGFLTR